MNKHFLLLLLMLSLSPAWAGKLFILPPTFPDSGIAEELPDTTVQGTEENKRLPPLVRKVIVPTVLIGLSVTHMDDEGLFEGSRGLRRVVQRHYQDFDTRLDDYAYYAPVAMAVGLNIAGVKGEHHFVEQAFLLSMTHFLNKTLANNLKSVIDINRPDGSNDDAFPSGHTSTAFAYATFFHKEYGPRSAWYSVAGYSFATATGAMRILNDKHWLSDVLAGAALGILSAEVVYQVYPSIQRLIAKSYAQNQQLAVMPFYSGSAGGLAIVYRIP